MLIDNTRPVFRQRCKGCVQRSIAMCAAGVVVIAAITTAALLHDEYAVFADTSAAVSSSREYASDGRVELEKTAGGIFAVVSAFSGSEEAIVSAIRSHGGVESESAKLPG